jgi:molybdopterin converting factor small subunit
MGRRIPVGPGACAPFDRLAKMRVTVQFFSFYKNLAGAESAEVELPDGAKVAKLVTLLVEQFPGLAPIRERAMFMIGPQIASRETVLNDGDKIIMFQLLGGG